MMSAPNQQRRLIVRINRALALYGQRLRKSRGRACGEFGDYFVCDLNSNAILDTHVEPTELAKELQSEMREVVHMLGLAGTAVIH
jgi:hypothetical protein